MYGLFSKELFSKEMILGFKGVLVDILKLFQKHYLLKNSFL